ncbi:MAG: SPOR domain-containing protein [Prolixibacteraceae bacterium]|nr:SPOR domain-containing protein [Prolixibacteraceae bacterium]
MKRIFLITIVSVLVLAACKTTKQTAQSAYTTEPTTQPKVFSVPAGNTETVTTTEAKEEEQPISMRKEQVSFTQQSDRVTNETNSFFVIIGSFSQLENAKNYRETLLSEGFTPIILHSETGYYRVCVNSYKNEQEARSRVSQVRQAFPKYSDIWLLIKE